THRGGVWQKGHHQDRNSDRHPTRLQRRERRDGQIQKSEVTRFVLCYVQIRTPTASALVLLDGYAVTARLKKQTTLCRADFFSNQTKGAVMRVRFFGAFVCLLLFAAMGYGVEKEKIHGKWELTEAVAGMPAGTIWDFRKDGRLVVSVGERSHTFTYSVEGSMIKLKIGEKKDETKITTLTDTELVCRDADGTTAKFKKVKSNAPKEK